MSYKAVAAGQDITFAISSTNKLYGWGHDGEIGSTLDVYSTSRIIKGIPTAIDRFNSRIAGEQLKLNIADFSVDRDENIFLLYKYNFYQVLNLFVLLFL